MIQLQVITDSHALLPLQPHWEALHARAQHPSVFNNWHWLTRWWCHYGTQRSLYLIAAWRGPVLVGLLPLAVQTVKVWGMVRVKMLTNLGCGGDTTPDDLDALVDPDCADAVAQALADHLCRTSGAWDVARICDYHADTALARAFARAGVHTQVSARISWLALPPSWDAYLATLHRDRRNLIRRMRRRAARGRGARFFVWDDPATLDAAFDRLVDLHRKRWAGSGGGSFHSPAYLGLHREVMHQLMHDGALRLYCLEIGSEIVAMQYSWRDRDTVYYFQSGFDPAHAALRPGFVLMSHAIEHAIGEGARVFDMLRGQYAFKTQWAPLQRELLSSELWRATPAALAWRLRHHVAPAVKRGVLGLAGLPGRMGHWSGPSPSRPRSGPAMTIPGPLTEVPADAAAGPPSMWPAMQSRPKVAGATLPQAVRGAGSTSTQATAR